jgi:hypothetical protein
MKNLTYKFVISIIISCVIGITMFNTANAQDSKFRQQAWRYGLNLGVQTNSAALGWQHLYGGIPSFQSHKDSINYVDGTGIGFYGGIFGEYLSESWWGIQMRISYDMRDALVIDDTQTPNSSFDTKMRYLTFEPLLRVDQKLIPNLNFYAGPFLAVRLKSSFYYKADKDATAVSDEFDALYMNDVTYGLQGGVAYDIRVADFDANTSMYVSPFVSASWLINQKEVTRNLDQNSVTDVWSTGSYRIGLRISMENRDPLDGADRRLNEPVRMDKKVFVLMPEDNTILTKNVKGYFPIHPYVFFEKGSNEIPTRYTKLTVSEARNFDEEQLGDFMKGELTVKETNVNQLMIAYYNVMNIYGDRMVDKPSSKLILRGSDPEEKNGENYANAVKSYLVDVWGISPNRITVEVKPPVIPSGSDATEAESKSMIDDENRRVQFIFNDVEMTKPLVYTIRDESSIDNDMIFSIGDGVQFKSWDLTITGEGKTMYFGPYAYSYARINPSELMRFLETGRYTAKVEITDRNGAKTSESTSFKLTKEKELKNATRYLMLFDYKQADAVKTYEATIRGDIVKGMVTGDRVIVHGHTDIIGNRDGNLKLSRERADEAKVIIVDQLKKDNKIVKVDAIGIGQSKVQYTFENKYPEGRMYNRNVFVEVIK